MTPTPRRTTFPTSPTRGNDVYVSSYARIAPAPRAQIHWCVDRREMPAAMELVRLALPRRVYLYSARRGLRFTLSLSLRFGPKADREAFSAASGSADELDGAPRNAVGDRERTNARAICRTVDRTFADAQDERPVFFRESRPLRSRLDDNVEYHLWAASLQRRPFALTSLKTLPYRSARCFNMILTQNSALSSGIAS